MVALADNRRKFKVVWWGRPDNPGPFALSFLIPTLEAALEACEFLMSPPPDAPDDGYSRASKSMTTLVLISFPWDTPHKDGVTPPAVVGHVVKRWKREPAGWVPLP